MAHVRRLLARVQRLEQAATRPSPFQLAYGSLEAFEAAVQKEMDAGKLCRLDMPLVAAAIRSWHGNNVYAMWGQRGQVWSYAGQR
jgi:hypothetical protein